jgi:hypothetical protein
MTADKIPDRADLAAEGAWVEMDEFLAWCEAEGPPKTADEQTQRDKRYLEIKARINARWLEIYRGASSGTSAQHLSAVNPKPPVDRG